jgi:hypothetical protein
MKKLPELIALGIGLSCLALAGAIAWVNVESPAAVAVEARQASVQHASIIARPGR